MSITYNLNDINEVAKKIVEAKKHAILCFEGEMGAGKTTLVNAICKHLGVAHKTSSPTFSLINEYLDQHNKSIFHFDFYRLNQPTEALDFGALDYFDSGNLCLIEWHQIILNYLPSPYHLIKINKTDENHRTLEFLEVLD